jgi:2,3-diaminopropionate biosynthesis protein SbnA
METPVTNSVVGRPLLDLAAMDSRQLRALTTRIGDTPLVPFELRLGLPHRLHLKLEGHNPGGSSKDRAALRIIDEYERAGRIRPGSVIVDSTSGNFGASMAWICRARGYRFHAVTDPHATQENLARMRSLGATVEIVDTRDESGGYLLTRLRRVDELVRTGQADVCSDQYTNPANPDSHRLTTGPELSNQLAEPAAVFICASTGGTLAGISRHVRGHWPTSRVVAVDGEGSCLFGGTPGPRRINGLGSSRPSRFLSPDLYDEVVRVSAAQATGYCWEMLERHGLALGGSSGAVLAAAVCWLASAREPLSVVCVCPDHGDLYRTSIFRTRPPAGGQPLMPTELLMYQP